VSANFPKSEHIKSEKEITNLFKNGKSIVVFPIRALYLTTNEPQKVKVMVSAPKKLFKKAVSRNYCKRLLREAYRLNKQQLTSTIAEKNYGINIAFSIIDKEKPSFQTISEKISIILNKILLTL
jgi:ribonuclease P protein component